MALSNRRRILPPEARHCFSAKAYCGYLDSLLLAAYHEPLGVCITSLMASTSEPHTGWMNVHDRQNAARGMDPGISARLKIAARQALGHSSGKWLKAYLIVPLPHRRGEVIIHHPTGWSGRGIAWSQGDARMAMVWNAG